MRCPGSRFPKPANRLQSLPACQTEAVLLRLAQDLLVVLTEPAIELAERGLLCSLSARLVRDRTRRLLPTPARHALWPCLKRLGHPTAPIGQSYCRRTF